MARAYQATEDFNIWPTFTDISFAILLLMIFIIFGQYMIIGRILQVNKIKQEQDVVRMALKDRFGKDFGYTIKESSHPQFQKLTFSDKVLFDTGSAELKPEGQLILTAIAGIIKKVHDKCSFDEIQVRGHTDDKPIRAGYLYKTNWELSSARATSVVRHFVDKCGLDPDKNILLSAQGYSQYDNIRKNIDEASRAFNRRIEIVIKYPLDY
jgi:flagellar motor protein MotB